MFLLPDLGVPKSRWVPRQWAERRPVAVPAPVCGLQVKKPPFSFTTTTRDPGVARRCRRPERRRPISPSPTLSADRTPTTMRPHAFPHLSPSLAAAAQFPSPPGQPEIYNWSDHIAPGKPWRNCKEQHPGHPARYDSNAAGPSTAGKWPAIRLRRTVFPRQTTSVSQADQAGA